MVKIIILEDDEKQAIYLESQLHNLCDFEQFTITKYLNEKDLLASLDSIEDNCIFFIDIVLVESSGIDIAKVINQSLPRSIIIFVSSHLNKVVDIYDATHCYFIFKPELNKRLPIALKKAIESLKQRNMSITIKIKKKTIVVPQDDIIYFERVGRTTNIYSGEEKYKESEKLESIKKKLLPNFVQCHRSYIVNFDRVKEIRRTEFELENGAEVPISRNYTQSVHEQFQKYLISKVK
ncbi:MAG: LytTR family DNA-binding domain-containing protein [Bacilli bacterium]